jgi:hypothetical protein
MRGGEESGGSVERVKHCGEFGRRNKILGCGGAGLGGVGFAFSALPAEMCVILTTCSLTVSIETNNQDIEIMA